MLDRISFVFLFVLGSFLAASQSLKFNWAVANNGLKGSVFPNKIITDSAENVFACGAFGDSADFNFNFPAISTLTPSNLLVSNGFIMKFDSTGTVIWKNIISGAENNITSITMLGNTEILASVIFKDSIDIDFGLGQTWQYSSSNTYNSGLLRFDTNGNLLSADFFNADYMFISMLTSNSQNEILVGGAYNGNVDFDIGVSTMPFYSNYYPGFIAKYDMALNFQFMDTLYQSIGNNLSGLNPNSIELDNAGNIFVSFGWNLRRYAPNSSIVYSGQFSNTNVRSIQPNNDGSLYVLGEYNMFADLDPTSSTYNPPGNGTSRGFVLKLNSDGELLWVYLMLTQGQITNTNLRLSTDGNLLIGGSFQFELDFDPTNAVNSINVGPKLLCYLLSLTENGEFNSVKTFGGLPTNVLNGMAIGQNHGVYMMGRFSPNQDDFNPGPSIVSFSQTNVEYATFLVKFKETLPNISYDTLFACNQYSSVNQVTYSDSSQDFSFNFVSEMPNGNDSIVNYHLLINQITGQIENPSDSTLAYSNPNYQFQWVNCNSNYDPISGADSSFFAPTMDGNYAVLVQNEWCQDTSDCIYIDLNFLNVSVLDVDQLQVNPIPASKQFEIINSDKILELRLYSMEGILMQEWSQADNNLFMLKNGLSDGNYILFGKNQNDRLFKVKIVICNNF